MSPFHCRGGCVSLVICIPLAKRVRTEVFFCIYPSKWLLETRGAELRLRAEFSQYLQGTLEYLGMKDIILGKQYFHSELNPEICASNVRNF